MTPTRPGSALEHPRTVQEPTGADSVDGDSLLSGRSNSISRGITAVEHLARVDPGLGRAPEYFSNIVPYTDISGFFF